MSPVCKLFKYLQRFGMNVSYRCCVVIRAADLERGRNVDLTVF